MSAVLYISIDFSVFLCIGKSSSPTDIHQLILTEPKQNTPRQLKVSHRLTWTIVIVFLICYFVNMILFGVQKPQFDQWCINKSRQDTSNYIFSTPPNNSTLLPNSQLEFTSRGNGLSLYNCTRLWEDEVKFSVVVFVILFTVYVSVPSEVYVFQRTNAVCCVDSFCHVFLEIHSSSYA